MASGIDAKDLMDVTDLLGVLGGGAVALVGAMIGAYFAHRLAMSRAHADRRTEAAAKAMSDFVLAATHVHHLVLNLKGDDPRDFTQPLAALDASQTMLEVFFDNEIELAANAVNTTVVRSAKAKSNEDSKAMKAVRKEFHEAMGDFTKLAHQRLGVPRN